MDVNDHLKSAVLFDVSHVTAVVTGGGSGIGLMITQALVANGAKVYITSRRQEVLNQVLEIYGKGPGKIIALQGDVSDKEDIQRLARILEEREPEGIQLLVNNAGVARDDATKYRVTKTEPDWEDPASISEHFMKSEPQAWEQTFRTNTMGPYFMSMALLRLLAKGCSVKSGYSSSVVNISSIAGVGKEMAGGQPAYAASKAALIHLSSMLGAAFSKTKVRVNTIAPGLFPSEMTTETKDENMKSKLNVTSRNPAGRIGKDEDIAAAILFLAGPGGVFYNEQTLFADGGSTLIRAAAK